MSQVIGERRFDSFAEPHIGVNVHAPALEELGAGCAFGHDGRARAVSPDAADVRPAIRNCAEAASACGCSNRTHPTRCRRQRLGATSGTIRRG